MQLASITTAPKRMLPSSAGSCSKDPIRFRGSTWNLFEYGGGNPETNLDSLGLRFGPAARPPVRPWRPGGPRGGSGVGTPSNPLPNYPFPKPNPFPPGYPKPGVNPGPEDPNYPNFVKQCWSRYNNSCKQKNPHAPTCGPAGKSTDEVMDDFAEDNVSSGLWPEAHYKFVDCKKVQEFNTGPFGFPFTPDSNSPCGTGPGYTLHCKVLVFAETAIWVSEQDAISVFICPCCDPSDPEGGLKHRPRPDFPSHFPGGNRPPDHNIDPKMPRAKE